eukprot:5390520-Pyramimonas_sp.AAC.1
MRPARRPGLNARRITTALMLRIEPSPIGVRSSRLGPQEPVQKHSQRWQGFPFGAPWRFSENLQGKRFVDVASFGPPLGPQPERIPARRSSRSPALPSGPPRYTARRA